LAGLFPPRRVDLPAKKFFAAGHIANFQTAPINICDPSNCEIGLGDRFLFLLHNSPADFMLSTGKNAFVC